MPPSKLYRRKVTETESQDQAFEYCLRAWGLVQSIVAIVTSLLPSVCSRRKEPSTSQKVPQSCTRIISAAESRFVIVRSSRSLASPCACKNSPTRVAVMDVLTRAGEKGRKANQPCRFMSQL